MSPTLPDRARRVARLGVSRSLHAGTAPLRGIARGAMRVRPELETRLADQAWLWQPGWGRAAHERLYSTPDPYGLATDSYEQSKYDLIMQELAGGRFARTLEVGCGEGLLSERLVGLTDELVGVDISESAVGRARERFRGDRGTTTAGRVRFERRTLPFDMPEGTFDLVVCSDVLYYWEQRTLVTGTARLVDRLRPGGTLLLLHYRGDFGQANSGDAVHDLAARRAAALPELDHRVRRTVPGIGPGGAGVRIDVLRRTTAAGPGGSSGSER